MKTDVPADAYLAQERPRDAAGSFIFKSGRRETKENGEDTHEAGHKSLGHLQAFNTVGQVSYILPSLFQHVFSLACTYTL